MRDMIVDPAASPLGFWWIQGRSLLLLYLSSCYSCWDDLTWSWGSVVQNLRVTYVVLSKY